MAERWERIGDETARAYEAFRAYRDAGPLRQLEPTERATLRTVTGWAQRYDWQGRAEAWDAEVCRVEDVARLQSIRDMHRLHADVAKAVIDRGMAALDRLDVEDIPASAAVRLIEMGVKLQRQTMTADELAAELEASKSNEDDPWEKLVSELTSSPGPATPHRDA